MDYFNPPRAPPPQSAVDGLSPEAPLAEDDISMWDFMQDPSIFDFPSLNLPPGIDTALDASLLSAGYLQYPYNQFNAASSESTSPSVSPYDLGVPLDDFRQPMPAGFPSDPQNPFFGNLEVPGAGYNGIINWQPQYPIQSPYSLTEDLSPQQLAVPDSTPFQDLLNSPQDPALASLLEDMESLLSSAPEVKVQPFPSQLQWDAAQFPAANTCLPGGLLASA
ncbi:hypothetical protein HKX48_003641 [Thoreauomyces humboldtii]|nr:hypothetical protein HKX48_003641 [Thoreauomyces humboldtii]